MSDRVWLEFTPPDVLEEGHYWANWDLVTSLVLVRKYKQRLYIDHDGMTEELTQFCRFRRPKFLGPIVVPSPWVEDV